MNRFKVGDLVRLSAKGKEYYKNSRERSSFGVAKVVNVDYGGAGVWVAGVHEGSFFTDCLELVEKFDISSLPAPRSTADRITLEDGRVLIGEEILSTVRTDYLWKSSATLKETDTLNFSGVVLPVPHIEGLTVETPSGYVYTVILKANKKGTGKFIWKVK